jgi:hypothetical protein
VSSVSLISLSAISGSVPSQSTTSRVPLFLCGDFGDDLAFGLTMQFAAAFLNGSGSQGRTGDAVYFAALGTHDLLDQRVAGGLPDRVVLPRKGPDSHL